jgi:drug/metabolite transporter (DMT)-like permease
VIDNPLRGIAFLVLATLCFSSSDTMAKYLSQGIPAIEIAWVRYVVFALFAVAVAARSGGAGPRTRRPWLQTLRGLCVVGSALFFILALHELPIAEATTINFASPLLITVLAVLVLGEQVGRTGWLLLALGFAGVLIVVRPGTSHFHFAAVYVVASSLCWAVGMMATRKMAGTDRSATTLLWTAGSGLVLLTVLLPFAFVLPGVRALGLTLLLGLVASLGQWFTILAYRHAGAATLAPLSYGQLIWSTVLGMIVFHNRPDALTLVGAAVIIASGLCAVQRERLRLRQVKAVVA